MKIGIIGLPTAGKTTTFNALTASNAAVHVAASRASAEPNIGIVSVPDERQDWLSQLYKPKKTTAATIEIVDIAGFGVTTSTTHKDPKVCKDLKDGLGQRLLSHLREFEVVVYVLRAFSNPAIPHPNITVDPIRDAELLELELNLADLAVIEKRLEKIKQEMQRKKGPEYNALETEADLLSRLKEHLVNELPLRQLKLSDEEQKIIRGYTFLSQKPLLIVANIDESDIGKADIDTIKQLMQFSQGKGAPFFALSAKTEMEINALEASARSEFFAALGIAEPGRDKLIKMLYQLLNVISFFTVGEDEVKAWTVPSGTNAQEAAKKIHSDIARGFIKAEVVSFNALKECGLWHHAKEKGLVRLEGKDYLVKDGDCINFRFAV